MWIYGVLERRIGSKRKKKWIHRDAFSSNSYSKLRMDEQENQIIRGIFMNHIVEIIKDQIIKLQHIWVRERKLLPD